MDPILSMQKGHFVHGSGTATVYHNRALAQRNGVWPILVTVQCDQSQTVSAEDANSFQINTIGNWKLSMDFLEPAEVADSSDT